MCADLTIFLWGFGFYYYMYFLSRYMSGWFLSLFRIFIALTAVHLFLFLILYVLIIQVYINFSIVLLPTFYHYFLSFLSYVRAF